jgi:uncharacterized Ntn-hydrolase superfamily protein
MTFSIVACCKRTGQLGVAVATAVPAVGAMCPYVRPGVGAVSTQSWVNPYLAFGVLDRIAAGAPASDALASVMKSDPANRLRQIGVVDAAGRAASWSGSECTPWFGHLVGSGFAVQGNMLVGASTIEAMQAAFVRSEDEQLAERLLLALEAGDAAGGDRRGRQSASLQVFGDEDYALVDLRVDEHAQPVTELRRVYGIARLQLFPFVDGMPKKSGPAAPAPEAVVAMLALAPPDRPGGGGSAPSA